MRYEKIDNDGVDYVPRFSQYTTNSERFEMSTDPAYWGGRQWQPEDDDDIHNPESTDHSKDKTGSVFTVRGMINLGLLSLVIAALLMLFAGYPIYDAEKPPSTQHNGQYAKFNSTGQVEWTKPNRTLIDADTPKDVYTRKGFGTDDREYQLVFSDEFEVEGRTFWQGDDPYWEASDLHYWGTNNLEWYSPRQATTSNGKLLVTLDDQPTHELNYSGTMITTWNKFCFTGGYLVANMSLPGASDVWGLWPAFWMMGNLGRAGYGASLDGLWPYSYDSCDVGTLQNQTLGDYPEAAYNQGGQNGATLSYAVGQRLSRCTCMDEVHPGPKHPDGTFVGRAASEIDVIEAQIDQEKKLGTVSMSGQWCPFDLGYEWNHDKMHIVHNRTLEDNQYDQLNSYQGGNQQQSTSVVVLTEQDAYQYSGGLYSEYGAQVVPGTGPDASIAWTVNDELRWQVFGDAVGPNSTLGISERVVTREPMYIIFNLGISYNFGGISNDIWTGNWPYMMQVEWVRVYQPKDAINIGCDPPEMPTASYISHFEEAYTNKNLTTWKQYQNSSSKVKDVKNALLYQDDDDCQIPMSIVNDKNLIGKVENDTKKAPHTNNI